MKRIPVKTGNPYEVLIGKSILTDIGDFSFNLFSPCKVCIITDYQVDILYGLTVEDSLSSSGFHVFKYSFEPGEGSKTLSSYSNCLEFLAKNKFSRTDLIFALGGGIVGDLAGFVAATYLRGIRFVQIPTTFLAAIDSSVGGKTGVNLSQGKNLAGCFWQPSMVICDTETFKSLSPEIFLDGVAEAIKYGIILDRNLFDTISANSPLTSSCQKLDDIISTCVKIKAKIVAEDERDVGLRQLLNLGHTIGHAIEKCSNYQISHGHAVATGIAIIAKASRNFGYTDEKTLLLIQDIIKINGFSTTTTFSAQELLQVILSDKKRGGSNINLILPTNIGDSEIREFPVNSLEGFLIAGLR